VPTISVFDMFKIGVGPSSSHTLGPWRIVQRFARYIAHAAGTAVPTRVRFELMGSLALTGRGHATDKAISLAMLGEEPETVRLDSIPIALDTLAHTHDAIFADRSVRFDPAADIAFLNERHPGHANAIRCFALLDDGREIVRTYFSVGGGFIASADELDDTLDDAVGQRGLPERPVAFGADLLRHCESAGLPISRVVFENELAWWTEDDIRRQAAETWRVMRESIERGCTAKGVLPGGLNVRRRAHDLLAELGPDVAFHRGQSLAELLRVDPPDFESKLRLVSCFALAVNEQNAAMGRVVTAPTNGAAGVIPAVMMYRDAFGPKRLSEDAAMRFLLVAGQVGALFKQNATISAAMGGCQAEIGVSSAMAAAGLTELMGGSPERALMAAEIAMEHHLGMTCDPVDGLVQVPCIERNAMGALKAISAAVIAMNSDPRNARVSFDDVVATMWETAQQMNDRYKETSQGGLAVNISVRTAEC